MSIISEMLFKREFKPRKRINASEVKEQYKSALSFVDSALRFRESVPEKIEVLNYIISMIKCDLQYEYASDMFYHQEARYCEIPFPNRIEYSNNIIRLYDDDNKEFEEVNFAKTPVLTYPWNTERLSDAITTIARDGFKYDPSNHSSYYYKYLDLCFVHNGFHHIAALHSKSGSIKSEVAHIERFFNHMKSDDGCFGVNSPTNKRIETIPDFRFAVLFEVAKLKYELENNLTWDNLSHAQTSD